MTHYLLACLNDLLDVVPAHLGHDRFAQLQVPTAIRVWTRGVHVEDMVFEIILIVQQFVRMKHLGVRQARAVSSR